MLVNNCIKLYTELGLLDLFYPIDSALITHLYTTEGSVISSIFLDRYMYIKRCKLHLDIPGISDSAFTLAQDNKIIYTVQKKNKRLRGSHVKLANHKDQVIKYIQKLKIAIKMPISYEIINQVYHSINSRKIPICGLTTNHIITALGSDSALWHPGRLAQILHMAKYNIPLELDSNMAAEINTKYIDCCLMLLSIPESSSFNMPDIISTLYIAHQSERIKLSTKLQELILLLSCRASPTKIGTTISMFTRYHAPKTNNTLYI